MYIDWDCRAVRAGTGYRTPTAAGSQSIASLTGIIRQLSLRARGAESIPGLTKIPPFVGHGIASALRA
jgi:hypothetical protein